MTMRGRDGEVSVVDEHAARAAAGNGQGLLVRAPEGCGLSRFLDAVPTAFDGALLRARGRRGESHIPWAVVRELAAGEEAGRLRRLLDDADDVPLPSTVLGWLAGAGATAIVVDDLDEADQESRDALAFAARRLGNLPVLVVLGVHDARLLADDLPSLELGPLPVPDLVDVLTERFGLVGSVARDIARAAHGIPLVALEVARSLDPAQRDGVAPLPEALLTHVSIPHAFGAALRTLPEATRRAVCVAAAEPTGELRVIAGALAMLGEHLAALDAAEEAGVIEIVDRRVVFDHPLRRNAAYHLLKAPSRRAAHRALASALDAPRDAERRATHLSLGVVEPDETVARDFELVAESFERRRRIAEAARWWRRAADLSPDSNEAARRRRRAERAGHTDADPIAGLTRAERRVAEVVGGGATNKEAAGLLFVSVKTVDTHLQSIYRKLGIDSRTELAVLMTRLEQEGS